MSLSRNDLSFLSDDVLRLNRSKLEAAGITTGTAPRQTEKGYLTFRGVRKYYKSKWEMNYAHYLEFLVMRGEIAAWDYEPETFWFEGIRRGVTNYTPDFRVEAKDGSVEFHEVKGYMDPKSKTKLARMKKYHPEVRMVLIQSAEIAALRRYAGMIPGWR